MLEYRDTPEGELRADDDTGTISGLAAVFYRKSNPGTTFELFDDVHERIMESAFDRALAEGDDVRGLFNHDSNFVFGRTAAGTLDLRKTARGLAYHGTPPDLEWVRGLRESIKRGDISGSSFQFQVEEETWREEKNLIIREISKVRLVDVGPVTFPAYKATNTKARAELRSIADRVRQESRPLILTRDRRQRIVTYERLVGDRFEPVSS